MVKFKGENKKHHENKKKKSEAITPHHHGRKDVSHLENETKFKSHAKSGTKVENYQTMRTPRGKG